MRRMVLAAIAMLVDKLSSLGKSPIFNCPRIQRMDNLERAFLMSETLKAYFSPSFNVLV